MVHPTKGVTPSTEHCPSKCFCPSEMQSWYLILMCISLIANEVINSLALSLLWIVLFMFLVNLAECYPFAHCYDLDIVCVPQRSMQAWPPG